MAAIRRVLEQVVADATMLPNSGERTRTIIAALRVALELVQAGAWEDRLAALEQRIGNADSRTGWGLLGSP